MVNGAAETFHLDQLGSVIAAFHSSGTGTARRAYAPFGEMSFENAALAAEDHAYRGSTKPPKTGPASSLHHIALSLPWEEQDAVIAWYEELGRDHNVEYFDWVGWRGVFTFDPDGNTVELVAKDPDWSASSGA